MATRTQTRAGAWSDRTSDSNRNGIPDYREHTLADANHNGIADYREKRVVDTNGNGIPDWRERVIDRDRDGIDDRAQNRYGGANCPPGLAKKTPACIPPGQAAKMFAVGNRLPTDYRNYSDINAIPSQYRDEIPEAYRTDAYRYVYRDQRIYVVDRATEIIRNVINLIR